MGGKASSEDTQQKHPTAYAVCVSASPFHHGELFQLDLLFLVQYSLSKELVSLTDESLLTSEPPVILKPLRDFHM